jgi:predicted nucleotidyltransferase
MLHKRDFIKKIQRLTHQWTPQAEVFLFGSRARGSAKSTSDWDLLILLNDNTVSFDTETKIMDVFYDLELETGQVISPLIYTKKQWSQHRINTPLFHHIENEGVRLQ